MLDQFVKSLEANSLLQAPGYVLAPGMLIVASALTILYRYLSQNRRYTLAEIAEQTFAISGWKSKSALLDIVVYGVGRVVPVLATGAYTILLAGGIAALAQPLIGTADPIEPGLPGLVAMGLILVVFLDFGDYVAHFMLHKVPILWEIHKVHHSATFLSPVTSFRNHPLEPQLYTICHSLTIAPPLAVMATVTTIGMAELLVLLFAVNTAVLLVTFNHLKHSHLQISLGPLDRVLISPHMHQLHHSTKVEHWDKNLGIVFSLWDWLFGTAVRADPRIPVIYGIGRGEAVDAQYRTLYGLFILPLVNMAKMAAGRLAPETRPGLEPGGAQPQVSGHA
jgi:sterol desaturase/sphingolipid hydroxylase (fatty acid hydroxylase superfamily)